MSKSLIIDAGHGGKDNGANGFGVFEKDWTLKMSLYQYKRLKELGANVSLTRNRDATLDSTPRTNKIKNKFDVCISNHFNAFNGSARGIETIHSLYGGKEFATDIANELVKATGLPLRRVFNRKHPSIKGADYYFMHRLSGSTRTIIIEYGFIDNKKDNTWYKNDEHFYKAAEAVIKAVCKEIGISYKKGSSETTKSTQTNGSGKMYKVQTGAFTKKENADKLAEKMKKDGYDTFIVFDGKQSVPKTPKKSIKEYADMIERTTITGTRNRANYLGLTMEEYKPVQEELNRRYR